MQKQTKESHQGKTNLLVIFILALVILNIFIWTNYFKSGKTNKTNASTAANAEVDELIKKVNSLIVLPQGETPTIATVSDKSKLKDQAFLKNAENGDKILIYAKAKKAILYRPSLNKIIETAPISLRDQQPTTAVTPTKSATDSPTLAP